MTTAATHRTVDSSCRTFRLFALTPLLIDQNPDTSQQHSSNLPVGEIDNTSGNREHRAEEIGTQLNTDRASLKST